MMMQNIYVLIKPASSLCNMRCKYCFYSDVSGHRESKSFGIMQQETVLALVQKTLSYAAGGDVTYAFQGGEPLVAGEAFFRGFSETVDAQNLLHSPIHYSLQTNGTLLTDSFCTYLKERDYLVGVSLDGPRKLHDANRIYPNGSGSFDHVRQGIALLRKYDVSFNILAVLTHGTVAYLPKLRTFFENYNLNDLQFITCLEPFGTVPFTSGYAMTNDDYYEINRMLFDWYWERNQTGQRLSIRHLDNLMNMLHGYRPEMCASMGYCSGQLVVEGNGNCYPCDFYCDDTHLLGNIQTHSLEEMSTGSAMQQFVLPSRPVDDACKQCAVGILCRGGCRRERDICNDGTPQRNIYCEGRKKFLQYVLRKLNIR